VVDGLAPESRAIDAALSSVALPKRIRSPRPAAAPTPKPRTPSGHVRIGPWVVTRQNAALAVVAAALVVLVPLVLVLVRGAGSRGPTGPAKRPASGGREAPATTRPPASAPSLPGPVVPPPPAPSREEEAPAAGDNASSAALAPEIAALEREVRSKTGQREYRAALDRLDIARRRSDSPEWLRVIDRLSKEAYDAAEGQFIRIKGKAQDARRQGATDEVEAYRAEVARWGIPRYVEALDRSLAEVQ
jgi:hypothetical protein